jgi:branched-chain amino acid transport system permease protein
MSNLWANYSSNVEFALIGIILSLAIFTGVWSGVLSVAPIGFASFAAFIVTNIDNRFQQIHHLLPIIGAAIGLALSLLIAPIFLRLSSHYLALATIAFVILTTVLALNLDHFTGGVLGIPVKRHISMFEVFIYTLAVMFVFGRLRRSSFGLKLEALREQPEIAASLGIDKLAFALGGCIGGLGGAIYAQMIQYIEPSSFGMHLAFLSLAAVVLGGPYHWLGPVLGTLVYAIIPEILRPIFGDSKDIGYGIIVIGVILLLPHGIVDPKRVSGFFENSSKRFSKTIGIK